MTPSGMPTRSDSDTAASMSASVCMLGSHRPITANDANAPSTHSAARQPPNRSTISTKAAVVPTQVMSSKSSYSRLTRSSRKELKPLKIENTKLGSSALRLSVSQTWKSSRYPVSEFHSSHAGHGNSLRQAKDATSIAPTIAADWTSRPRHHGRCSTTTAGATYSVAMEMATTLPRLRSPSGRRRGRPRRPPGRRRPPTPVARSRQGRAPRPGPSSARRAAGRRAPRPAAGRA